MNQYRSQSGKPRAKVRAGTVQIGDIIESINVYIPDQRVTGLGKVWTEQGYLDAEDARSFGGTGERRAVTDSWQYAYTESTGRNKWGEVK